jgi:hypothetical protein
MPPPPKLSVVWIRTQLVALGLVSGRSYMAVRLLNTANCTATNASTTARRLPDVRTVCLSMRKTGMVYVGTPGVQTHTHDTHEHSAGACVHTNAPHTRAHNHSLTHSQRKSIHPLHACMNLHDGLPTRHVQEFCASVSGHG